MRALWGLTLVLLLSWPSAAAAQLTQKCEGETWEALASSRYGDGKYGVALAIHNRAAGTAACTPGKFVRFLSTTRHTMKLGQPLSAVVSRFLRGEGAMDLIRAHNKLPRVEPKPGTEIEIPAELALSVGTRPEAELAEIPGLPPLDEIKKYNGVRGALSRGGTIYVPLFLTLKPRESAPPVIVAPPVVPPVAPPESPVSPHAVTEENPTRTTTAADVALSFSGEPLVKKLTQIVRAEIQARPAEFLHGTHSSRMSTDWRCETCHFYDPRRPGIYFAVPVGVCTQCHVSADVDARAFRASRLPLTFSHVLHVSPDRQVVKSGYNLECATCHPPAATGLRHMPAHPECKKCHNGVEAKPAVDADCAGCHGVVETLDRLTQAAALLDVHLTQSPRLSDVRFAHEEHVAFLGDGEKACDRCHLSARTAESTDEIEPPMMGDCLECHRGLSRELAGETTSLDRCRTCHITTRPFERPWFDTVVEKPISHTVLFRQNHRRQAAEDRGTCTACHNELAGANGNNCDRCHEQMRPQDHGVRWREEPHGRAAIRKPDRCATCHLQDRCADCHSIRPRDHFPIERFRLQHGRSARRSLQRCFTCHIPLVDCAKCHDVGGT